MSHPGAEVLSDLLDALDGRQLDGLQHVLQCRVCRVRLRPILVARRVEEAVEEGLAAAYDEIWERLEESVLSAAHGKSGEAGAVEALLAELLALPQAEREEAVATDERFRSWALAGRLLEAGRRDVHDDPAAGIERIHLALALGERLDPSGSGEGPAASLQTRAHCYLGESLVAAGDPAGAEAAFQHAALYLEGSADPLDRAWFCHLLARMRAEEGRRDEAAALAGRAATLFVRVGQLPEAAVALLGEVRLLLELLDPELALEPIHRLNRLSQLGLLPQHRPQGQPPELATLLARFTAAVEAGELDATTLERLLAGLVGEGHPGSKTGD